MMFRQRRDGAEAEQEKTANHRQQTDGRGLEAFDEIIAGAQQDRHY
jgi:hypothetical protein